MIRENCEDTWIIVLKKDRIVHHNNDNSYTVMQGSIVVCDWLTFEQAIGIVKCHNMVLEKEESKTMFGFPIKHLVMIATWLRKNDITPEILKSSIESIKYGYDIANQEMKDSFEEVFKTMKKAGN